MLPAPRLATPGDLVTQPLGPVQKPGETLTRRPLQQFVQEGPGGGSAREPVQPPRRNAGGRIRHGRKRPSEGRDHGVRQGFLQGILARGIERRRYRLVHGLQGGVTGHPPRLAQHPRGGPRQTGGRLRSGPEAVIVRGRRGQDVAGRAGAHPGLERRVQVRGGHGRPAIHEIAQGAPLEMLDGAHAQPGGVPGAGQGDIQLAEILAQPLAVGARQPFRTAFEVEPRAAVIVMPFQRVFQALGFVHGDDLHQVGIAFQPELALARVQPVGAVTDLFGQMANQRLLAFQRGAGCLQDFGQVQQIGQHPLAVARGVGGSPAQAARRDREIREQAPQHRQHALPPPGLPVGAKLQDPRFPGSLVAIQGIQRGPVQAQRGRRQRGAQPVRIVRFRAGFQPVAQFGRLRTLKD